MLPEQTSPPAQRSHSYFQPWTTGPVCFSLLFFSRATSQPLKWRRSSRWPEEIVMLQRFCLRKEQSELDPQFCTRPGGPHPSQPELQLFPPPVGVRAADTAWLPDSGLSVRGVRTFWGRTWSRERDRFSELSWEDSEGRADSDFSPGESVFTLAPWAQGAEAVL